MTDTWPDWCDAGKNVEVELENGLTVNGQLLVDDFFPDGQGGEIPIFVIRADDGKTHQFAANRQWKFT